jgi:GNAT superfamily N-acetyltransferase
MTSHQDNQEQFLEECSRLISKTFLRTPSYVEVCRIEDNDELLEACMYSFFSKHLRMMYDYYPESFHPNYEEDKMICFFTLVPGDSHFSLWQELYYGLWSLPFEMGLTATQRLIAAGDFYDAKIKKLLNGRDGLVLERMVVHPSVQGKGIGSKCLRDALESVADKKGLPVALSTQEIKNVTFYSRL